VKPSVALSPGMVYNPSGTW